MNTAVAPLPRRERTSISESARRHAQCLLWGIGASLLIATASGTVTPTADLEPWVVEQQPGGTVTIAEGGAIVVDDAHGCTLWWRAKLTAPMEISYEVTVVARGGPNDRVSDVNCFWMASDPAARDGRPQARSGKFEEYDTLRTYYVGMGGNNNTTTRFRRYAGDGTKPLLPEHDLKDRKFLLEANRTYHLRLVARDGVAEFWRDGEKIFSYRDPEPLTGGWFGFRTVKSHLVLRNFLVREG